MTLTRCGALPIRRTADSFPLWLRRISRSVDGIPSVIPSILLPMKSKIVEAWPRWFAYAAAAWSFGYGCLALAWAAGGPGFPFESMTALTSLRRAAALLAVLCLLASWFAARLTVITTGAWRLQARVGLAWATAITLAVLVPDSRAIAAAAYAPIFLLGAPFGWPPVSFSVAVPWPVWHQYICITGGFLWAAAALGCWRRGRHACVVCGRAAQSAQWTQVRNAARWGRWATWVAVIVPLFYATTRIAWALGIPLGITDAFLREGQEIGMWWAGAALASVAIGGAILTLGLQQHWGEVFPGWIPMAGGRRVPPLLAIIPAGLVATLSVSAGLDTVGHFLRAGFPDEGWGATAPGLLWPLWGAALGAATLAYYYRRRGPCERCGRA